MPATPAVDTFAIAFAGLKAVIDDEFADEQIVAVADELHEALGYDGIYVGIAPARMAPAPANDLAQHTILTVQFFDLWDKEVDDHQEVDPRRITGFHARLLERLRTASVAVGDGLWYFRWQNTEFPRDPTGNKTRFVMTIQAWSNNTSFVETVA